jgi:hypothetical protein
MKVIEYRIDEKTTIDEIAEMVGAEHQNDRWTFEAVELEAMLSIVQTRERASQSDLAFNKGFSIGFDQAMMQLMEWAIENNVDVEGFLGRHKQKYND